MKLSKDRLTHMWLLGSQLLYTFDKQVCVSSCSLNKEETLLGKTADKYTYCKSVFLAVTCIDGSI